MLNGSQLTPVIPVICFTPSPSSSSLVSSPSTQDFVLSGEAGAAGESLVQGCEGGEPRLMAGTAHGGAMGPEKAGGLPGEGEITSGAPSHGRQDAGGPSASFLSGEQMPDPPS